MYIATANGVQLAEFLNQLDPWSKVEFNGDTAVIAVGGGTIDKKYRVMDLIRVMFLDGKGTRGCTTDCKFVPF